MLLLLPGDELYISLLIVQGSISKMGRFHAKSIGDPLSHWQLPKKNVLLEAPNLDTCCEKD